MSATAATPAPAPSSGLMRRDGVLARLVRDRIALVAAVVLALIALAAVFAPLIAPYDPYFTDLSKSMAAPSAERWFGTDNTCHLYTSEPADHLTRAQLVHYRSINRQTTTTHYLSANW